MTWEAATFGISIIVLAMQGAQLYTSAKLKLWALEKFVTKSDFLDSIQLWGGCDNYRPSNAGKDHRRHAP